MINVLLDTGNAPPKTGIGIYGELLLGAMQNYHPRDITISEAKIGYPAYSLRPLRRLAYLLRLGLLRRSGFQHADVVHFINQYAPPRQKRVAYVVSIHDLDPMILPDAHTKRYAWYFERSIRLVAERAHLIVTQSSAVRRDVLELLHLPPELVCIGGDGLSEEFMQLAERTTSSTPEIPTLLYVGQLSKKKNVAWVIRALREGMVSGGVPPLKLELAGGEGFGAEEIRAELAKNTAFVRWHNRPTLETIVGLYRRCSAVLLPSLREGFGRPLLEAMYCDKPIVASRIPTSVEIAGEGAHFFSLNDADELYEAVKGAIRDSLHEARKERASTVLPKYSWQNLVEVYSEIYMRAACLR